MRAAMLLPLAMLAMLALVASSVAASSSPAVAGRGPLPTSCSGQLNTLPTTNFDLSSQTPLRSVENGTLYSVLPANATTPLLVLHVRGSSYAQGVAYGALLQGEMKEMIPAVYAYLSNSYGLPQQLVDELLDLTRNATKAFTPAHHLDFLQGMSDGTGGAIEMEQLWRLSLFPELIKAACSIAGAWGPATASGNLLQLRALDWRTDGPFQQWPLLATFHPEEGDGNTYTTMGFVTLYGTLTGWSSSGMVVSEKFWAEYDKLDNILGYPWPWLLQDILRYDADIDEAMSRVAQASRTCAMWLGFGQAARANPHDAAVTLPADFRLVAYSFQEVHFYNPENFPVYAKHDYFPSLLFVDKHVQPSHDPCQNDLFHWAYGSLTADDLRTLTALAKTGDMHIGVYDAQANVIFVANAEAMPNNRPAYGNGFVRFDMNQMWKPMSGQLDEPISANATAAAGKAHKRQRIVLA